MPYLQLPLYSPRTPSCFTIFLKQSYVPLYINDSPGFGIGCVCNLTYFDGE